MTKSTKWSVRPAKTQISLGIRPVWSESSLSDWRSTGSLATYWAHSEDSDQSWRILKLIRRSLLGAHIILLVFSWSSLFIYFNFSLLHIIIIIISLFQEDECQSNIWSSITKVEMTLGIEHAYIIYSMYRAGEVSIHRACCERATQPYSLGGGGTIWPGSRAAGGYHK